MVFARGHDVVVAVGAIADGGSGARVGRAKVGVGAGLEAVVGGVNVNELRGGAADLEDVAEAGNVLQNGIVEVVYAGVGEKGGRVGVLAEARVDIVSEGHH